MYGEGEEFVMVEETLDQEKLFADLKIAQKNVEKSLRDAIALVEQGTDYFVRSSLDGVYCTSGALTSHQDDAHETVRLYRMITDTVYDATSSFGFRDQDIRQLVAMMERISEHLIQHLTDVDEEDVLSLMEMEWMNPIARVFGIPEETLDFIYNTCVEKNLYSTGESIMSLANNPDLGTETILKMLYLGDARVALTLVETMKKHGQPNAALMSWLVLSTDSLKYKKAIRSLFCCPNPRWSNDSGVSYADYEKTLLSAIPATEENRRFIYGCVGESLVSENLAQAFGLLSET